MRPQWVKLVFLSKQKAGGAGEEGQPGNLATPSHVLKLPWKPGENGKTSSNYPYKVSHFSASFWGVAMAESLGMFVGLGNGHMKKGL